MLTKYHQNISKFFFELVLYVAILTTKYLQCSRLKSAIDRFITKLLSRLYLKGYDKYGMHFSPTERRQSDTPKIKLDLKRQTSEDKQHQIRSAISEDVRIGRIQQNSVSLNIIWSISC